MESITEFFSLLYQWIVMVGGFMSTVAGLAVLWMIWCALTRD